MPRRYGQHFLTDPMIAERVVDASGAGERDGVFEIGPGRGLLTRVLARRAGKVLAVELDRRLFSELRGSGLPRNVELRLGDALKLSDDEIASALGASYRVVSNLPYEITTETLTRFLSTKRPPRSLTLMLQEEVGKRITEADGRSSRLSLFCGYHAEARLAFCLPPGAFSPPPKVRSCVIRLDVRKKKPLPSGKEALFFSLIEAAFASKRKKVGNVLGKKLGPDAEKRLSEAGIAPDARPEQIPLNAWISLALKS